MKKILCALLAVLMIVCAAPLTVSAAAPVTKDPAIVVTPGTASLDSFASLGSYIGTAKNGSTVFVSHNVEVSTDTVIPKTVTVVIMPGVTLYVSAKLLVEGSLVVYGYANPFTQMNITSNRGFIDYAPTTGYWWDDYVDQFRSMTEARQQGYLFCDRCGHAITKCDTCLALHCPNCGTHSSQFYCFTHKQAKTFCPTCGGYFCDKCGTHSHTSTAFYCYTHKQLKSYCSICGAYYCDKCTTHTHTGTQYYCTVHNQLKTYCTVCGGFYCTKCGDHAHTGTPVVPFNPNLPEYYYLANGYVYLQGSGWVYLNLPEGENFGYYGMTVNGNYLFYNNSWIHLRSCDKATASIKNGSKVPAGTTVELTTKTKDAAIYYTTDGTIPTLKSTLYTAPITLTAEADTIKAIVIKKGFNAGPLSVFEYNVEAGATFGDIAAYDGLAEKLSVLIGKGILADGKEYDPDGTVSYADLIKTLEALGQDTSKVKFDYKDADTLTNEDVVYITYRVLKANKTVATPKISGNKELKVLKNLSDITDKAIYKAAYTSFIEHEMLIDTAFAPQSNATRAFFGYAMGTIAQGLK